MDIFSLLFYFLLADIFLNANLKKDKAIFKWTFITHSRKKIFLSDWLNDVLKETSQ